MQPMVESYSATTGLTVSDQNEKTAILRTMGVGVSGRAVAAFYFKAGS